MMVKVEMGRATVHYLRAIMTGIVVAGLATLGLASPALATVPTGDFAVFSDCPLSNPAVVQCIYSTTTGGEVKLGKTAVPISKTVTLQGGVAETETAEVFVGAADGNTLSKTALNVPGGLAGLVNCPEINNALERILCELTFENGVTGVTATTELAAPASSIGINEGNLLGQVGTALSLPVKVKLDNPLLGSQCYIGSNANPIVLNLTTGATAPPPPNKSISGSKGQFEFKDGGEYAISRGVSLVDNSFAAPGATGCGGLFAFLLDPIINAKVGIPAAAGNNTAILSDPLQIAGAGAVKASEK
jgi:hypothetical protein